LLALLVSQIQYVWGWDPKDNSCPSGSARGWRGAVVGFTFDQGSASCIMWVTTEEAFLECVRYGRRTRTLSIRRLWPMDCVL